MKKTIISLSIILTACSASVNEKKQDELKTSIPKQGSKPSVSESQLAVKKDPVCGMPAFKFMEDTTLYHNKIYGFCGKGCKEEFLKNPEKYSH
jgi:YHS domain-containing protein